MLIRVETCGGGAGSEGGVTGKLNAAASAPPTVAVGVLTPCSLQSAR